MNDEYRTATGQRCEPRGGQITPDNTTALESQITELKEQLKRAEENMLALHAKTVQAVHDLGGCEYRAESLIRWLEIGELKEQLANSERRYGELSNAFDNLLKYKNEMQEKLAKAEGRNTVLLDALKLIETKRYFHKAEHARDIMRIISKALSDTAGSEGQGET